MKWNDEYNFQRLKVTARELAGDLRKKGMPETEVYNALGELTENANIRSGFKGFDTDLILGEAEIRRRLGVNSNEEQVTVRIMGSMARRSSDSSKREEWLKRCWRRGKGKPTGD